MVVQADAGVTLLGVGQAVVGAGAGLHDGVAEGFIETGLRGIGAGVGQRDGVADGVVDEVFLRTWRGGHGLVGVEDRADAAAQTAGADEFCGDAGCAQLLEVGAAVVTEARGRAALGLAEPARARVVRGEGNDVVDLRLKQTLPR